MDGRMMTVSCPYCGHLNDQHEGAEESSVPQERDLSLCAYCWKVSIFTQEEGEWKLSPPTDEEWAEWQEHPEYIAAMEAVKKTGNIHDVVQIWRETAPKEIT